MSARHNVFLTSRPALPWLALVAATLMLIATAAVASAELDGAFERSARITRDTTQRIEVTLRLQKLLQRAALPVHHYHIDGNPEQRMHFAMLAGQIDATFDEAVRARGGNPSGDLAAIRASWQDLRTRAASVLAMPDPNSRGLPYIHGRVHALDEQVLGLSERVSAVHDADRARTGVQLDDAARWNHTLTRVVIGAFLVALFSVMLGAAGALRSRALMRELSTRDALTGLFNRREFQARLRGHLASARRLGLPCSVLLLDVDHFKAVNDTHGHDVGDLVLRELAAVIGRVVRRTDVVARFGGEELIVLLPGTDEDAAVTMGDRVREAVAGHPRFLAPDGTALRVTVSVGVATFPVDAPVEDSLIRAADQAMYLAKRSGRNRVARQPA